MPESAAEARTEGLQLFINDLARGRLLTAQEEVRLAKRIERGDFDAKRTMIESNLRLVVSIAKHYRNQVLELRYGLDGQAPWTLCGDRK